MSDTLLPFNATITEKNLEAVTKRLGAVPVPVSDLWDPQTCPASILPWLAWALSVDNWDKDWDEATQRSVVAASISVHYKKGTVKAVKEAIEAAGFPNVYINEAVGTWAEFELATEFTTGLTKLSLLIRLINSSKPARSHLRSLGVTTSPLITTLAPIVVGEHRESTARELTTQSSSQSAGLIQAIVVASATEAAV